MPNAANFKSSQLVKLLLIGESGSGKTGACASLALAGYKVRVLEFDNGVDSMIDAVKRTNPKMLSNIDYLALRDARVSSPGGPIIKSATAFVDGMRLLDNWDPASCTGIDPDYKNDTKFGRPGDWGPECVLVIDSLTFLADAAYNYFLSMNPTAGQKGGMDMRNIYGLAQRGVEQVLALLTGDSFNTNLIMISHISYQERSDGTTKGLPKAIGDALGPKIPAYFHSFALVESTPGAPSKKTIRTVPNNLIDLKNPASNRMPSAPFPIETGLADFFKVIKE